MRRASAVVLVSLLAVLSSCAHLAPPPLSKAAGDGAALARAAEAFYAATSPAELRAALAAAKTAGPDSATFHELAARMAQLDGQDAEAADQLLAALVDTGDDAALLHLHTLLALDTGWAQRPRLVALLEALAAGHPSLDVRSLAAHHLAGLRNQEGDVAARTAALAGIPGRLAFAVVGTWDNDQGKGFDLELDPERRAGLGEKYEGRNGIIGWRPSVPADPRGRLDLAALMTPNRWSVAYAQAAVEVPAAGDYALHLLTVDPLKVFVDGAPVFSASQLERGAWEALVVPVRLSAGKHVVLVKSAHRDGAWWLAGRLGPLEAPFVAASPEDVARWHVRAQPEGTARRAALLAAWMHVLAGGPRSVQVADAWVRQAPKSVMARVSLVDALWYNQERGRTADLLAALDAEVGDQLALVRLRQLRFHQQQGLKLKARAKLLELVKAQPRLKDAWAQLADLYRSDGWTEDELAALRAMRATCVTSEDDDGELARALLRHGKRREALELYDEVLDRLPATGVVLRAEADLALDAGDLGLAERLLERRLASWPTDFGAWLSVAEVRRRRGDVEGAQAALEAAALLAPEAPAPVSRKGDLLYEAGDLPHALTAWRRALELNPENDALANRIDFHAPEARGPWMADIPDEATLARAVRLREGLKPQPGADAAWLLDHEVTLLNSDGSTSNVVTLVIHAFNAQGRDRIIRQSVGAGRLRVLHSYSVDEKGQRSEASSERNRQIFFRAMQPGSTLVLQYRLDAPPKGFLARFFTESWSFQGASDQRAEGTYVLWAPLGTTLHEQKVGDMVVRAEERRGDQLRFTWTAKNVPPVPWEPSMPPQREVAANISLSTVPDWKTWLSWEQALLDGVFRDSPEIDALAKKLGEGADSPQEKLLRVHEFVMDDIRYQQDYETFIAGVKPHAAPVVLERRYGDCKDKAVLFITLAKKLGLDAQFALVRTRDAGPVQRDVPSQQFNHAIVWVPEQPGVASRFFDPTADLLDLAAVRTDDVGTQALVFDPKTGQHAWRDIDFQAPAMNAERNALTLSLAKDGAAKGQLVSRAQGRVGSAYRQMARNAEMMQQLFQRTIGALVPGAAASNVKATALDLRAPAEVTLDVEARSLGRVEGDALRLRLPTDVNPRRAFALPTRRHALLLGYPQRQETTVELALPEGATVQKLPAAAKVELPCLSLERTVTVTGGVVRSTQAFEQRCERLSVAEYGTYREAAEEMARLLDDELVVGLTPAAAAGKGGKPVPVKKAGEEKP